MYPQKMSTSLLYAHLFVNMCKIYWMLNAMYEDLFKAMLKIIYLFEQTYGYLSLDMPCLCKSLL